MGNGFGIGLVDLLVVVAINLDGVPAECSRPLGIRLRVPLELGRATLSQTVHIKNGRQIIELVIPGLVQRLPNRALSRLAIPEQNPYMVGQLVQIFAIEGDPYANWQSLPERAGCDIDPGQYNRNRMSFQPAAEFAKCQQLFVADD